MSSKVNSSPVSSFAAGRHPARELWDDRYASLPADARQEPVPFVTMCLPRLPAGGRALDVAAGAGRHSLALARLGWQVDAVDISPQGLRLARQRAGNAGLLSQICFIVADIERPWLPCRRYDLVLVSFFLSRPLLPLIKERLAPGGWLIYETFTVERLEEVQKAVARRPPRREFLLERDELRAAFSDFEMLFYEEGYHRGRATAQLLARKPLCPPQP